MRKIISFILGCIVLLFALEIFLPKIAVFALNTVLTQTTKAQTVATEINASPSLNMLLGKIDHLRIHEEKAELGDFPIEQVTLQGKNLQLGLSEILQGQIAVYHADELKMTGTITEENLMRFLKEKLQKGKISEEIKNMKIKISPEIVSIDGEIKLLGSSADVHIEGKIFGDESSQGIYFRTKKVRVKKFLFGLLDKKLDADFLGDIELFKFERLHLPVTLDDIQQGNGQALIRASRKS